jgi:hypothetical protein
MFNFNRDVMRVDGEDQPQRIISTERNDTSKITQAEMTAASIAAARELAMTPYAELSADERRAMTQKEKMDYLQAAREEQARLNAEERAASNPMFDFSNRPEAPTKPGMIQYYSWIGDTNTGSWKLYSAPDTAANQAKYGARSTGGETQATPDSPVGANSLVNPPTWNPATNSWNPATDATDTTTTTVNPTVSTTTTTNPTVSTTTTTNPTVSTTTVNTTGLDAATRALIESLQRQITNLTNTNTATTAATQYNERMSVYATMADRFNKYGLTGLANKIKELAMQGATEATITLQLMETPEYQQRFAANADRIKSGLKALTPAEYVNIEDSYRQVLRAYGLRQFDNDAYVRQFIANDMSPTELSNRVVTAVQRVQNADPAIVAQLKQYYGIGATDMVAYVLDPQQQFQKIERQIAASEIGVAAGRQGLTAGVSVAEQLAAQGVSQAEAQKGYATIADILPTAEKLSDIYGTTLDEYRQSEGEQEVFNQLASAQRKRQRLTQREVAAFSGASGVNKTSLSQQAAGQY